MKVTKVTYIRGMTINLGDYESLRIDIGAEADVDVDEDFEEARGSLKKMVDSALRTEVRVVRDRLNSRE